ncbi:MAG: hypothetical protein AAF985_03575 [Bacteroidota bacterium]
MKRSPDQEEHPEIRAALSERFGVMRVNEEAPKELKKEVFNTLDTIQLFADIADLFTIKFTRTELDFLDLSSQQGAPGPQSDDEEELGRLK